MLKNLPKMLPGISQKFHLLYFSVFLLCLHYTPKLPTILSIVLENLKLTNDCSIRVFHYKVTVLLESIDLRSYVQCIRVLFCILNILLTALLESFDLF